jgi:hypothetical protein
VRPDAHFDAQALAAQHRLDPLFHEIREVDADLHADHHPADVDQDLASSMATCRANPRRVKPNAVRSIGSPAKGGRRHAARRTRAEPL